MMAPRDAAVGLSPVGGGGTWWTPLGAILTGSSPSPPLQSPEVVRAVGKLSYNQLVEKIITCKHSGDPNLVTEGGSRAGGAQGRPGPLSHSPPTPRADC